MPTNWDKLTQEQSEHLKRYSPGLWEYYTKKAAGPYSEPKEARC